MLMDIRDFGFGILSSSEPLSSLQFSRRASKGRWQVEQSLES